MIERVKYVSVMCMALLLWTDSAQSQTRINTTNVLDRKPTSADGEPAYRQDMRWLDPDGRSWVMRDTGHGHAVWLSEEPTGLVLDAIGGAKPNAAYSTQRLTSGYTGPSINIVNTVTKAATNIGFLPDGSLDEAALAAFCARGECRVAKWYDQSGHGQDAVQNEPSARPALRLSHRIGKPLSLIWDFEATSGGPGRGLILPNSLTIDSGNMAVLWTGSFHNASLISPLVELGTDADAFNFGYWDAHGDFYLGTHNHLTELAGHAALTPAIGMISSSQGEGIVTNYRNKMIAQDKLPPELHQGGLIGQTVAYKQNGMIELSSLILYGRGLNPMERFVATQALSENFRIPQQQTDVYVADGDSLTQGIYTCDLQSYPWYMERLLPSSLVVYNAAWAAKTLGGADGLVARYAAFTNTLFNPAAHHNIISIMAGTNDIQNGADDREVLRLLQQYSAAARKTGFKVIVSTILPRASFSPKMETFRLNLNTALRANWKEFADGLSDFAGDPAFSDAKIVNDHTIYAEDGIHLTDAGYQILASIMSSSVRGLSD